MKIWILQILFSALMFLPLGSFAQHPDEHAIIEKEINEIIQLAIDLPELQQYFHKRDSSLSITLPAELDSVNIFRVTKFNQPVTRSVNSDADLKINNWVTRSTAISFQLSYPIEGIIISYQLTKETGSWVITKHAVMER